MSLLCAIEIEETPCLGWTNLQYYEKQDGGNWQQIINILPFGVETVEAILHLHQIGYLDSPYEDGS